ncbi:hypothetical protein RF55_7406, partial [Lasius niger]
PETQHFGGSGGICRRTVTGLVTSKTCNKIKMVKTGTPVLQLTDKDNGQHWKAEQ